MTLFVRWTVVCAIFAFAVLLICRSVFAAEPSVAAVPSAPIYAGTTISEDALVARSNSARPPGHGQLSRASVVGKVARRTLLPGQPITEEAVRAPYVISYGQSVHLLFEMEGLQIVGEGIAMEAAGVGDRIRIRNGVSGVAVYGRVLTDNTVSVGGEK